MTKLIDRRAVLAGAGNLAAVGAAATFPMVAKAATPDSDVSALWVQYRQAQRELAEVTEKYGEAEKRLPWWAASGLDAIDSDGRECGSPCGWPARIVSIPEPGVQRVTRPSLHSLRQFYDAQYDLFRGTKHARAIRDRYRVALRNLNTRIAAQRRERERVGLDELAARIEALCDDLQRVEKRIFDLSAECPDVVAAQALIGLETHDDILDNPDADTRALTNTLTHLCPRLCEPLAQSVRTMFETGSARERGVS